MKSVTERTWWQPAIQFSVPTPKLQESTHETEKKVGLFYDVLWCSGWVCSCSLFRVPRSILRTSGLASSGSEGRPQTFTECTAPRCTEALVLSTVLWVSMDYMKLELELHGIPWNSMESSWDAGAQAKQAFHKLPYKSPSEKGHQGSSLADPIRSYQILSGYRVSRVYMLWSNTLRRLWSWEVSSTLNVTPGTAVLVLGLRMRDFSRATKTFQDVHEKWPSSCPFRPFHSLSFHFIRNLRYSDIRWLISNLKGLWTHWIRCLW